MSIFNILLKSMKTEQPKSKRTVSSTPQTPVRKEVKREPSEKKTSYDFDIESFLDYNPQVEASDVVNRGLLIQSTLADFGPVVMLKKYKEEGKVCIYAYKLDRGVTITSIRILKEDIALALAAKYIEMCAIKGTQFFAIITDNPYAPLEQNEEPNLQGKDGNVYDGLFVYAGRLVIESDKASVGYLQRNYRIGFNRACRIMDQLYEKDVVGTENGTKPRNIKMSLAEFDELVNKLFD